MLNIKNRISLFIAVSLAAAAPARAVEDVNSPRSVGMGGALRGDAAGALGPLLNPAGLPLRKNYVVEAMYGFRFQDLGSTLHLSVTDSVTSRVSAGLYYTYVHSSPRFTYGKNAPDDPTREGHETGLSLALPLGERFAFGLTSKYVRVSTEVANPAYDVMDPTAQPKRITVDSSTSAASADGFTVDFGLALRAGEAFSMGVVGYNLIPLRSVEAPMGVGAGLAYTLGRSLTLAFDTVIQFGRYKEQGRVGDDGKWIPGDNRTTVKLGGGAEYLIAGRVPLRAGAEWDSGRPGAWFTAGLGVVASSFAIDLALRQKVQHGADTYLMLGIRLFLE